MKCPYCDSEFDIEALKKNEETLGESKMEWKMSGDEWKSGEEGSLRSYICESCGAEIVADETTGATSCPYCGNSQRDTQQRRITKSGSKCFFRGDVERDPAI